MVTYYSKLSIEEQRQIIKKVIEEIPVEHRRNDYNGYEWDEPEHTIEQIKSDANCCYCWMPWYNCLCSHDE